MVYHILHQAHLQVGLTQNREIMTLQNLKPWFILSSCVEGPHEKDDNEIAFGWEPDHACLYTTLENLWPHKY